MKKLKCNSCGAELKVESDKDYAVCEHCGSKYKLNEDLNINIKIDDNVKNLINNSLGIGKHLSIFLFIPIILFAFVLIIAIVFSFNHKSSQNKESNQNKEQYEKQIDNFFEESQKEMFNFEFNSAAGTKSGFFLENILDDIIKSNKTHDRQISLIYNGKSTTDENEIIKIKQGLDANDNYEVSISYDDNGYISEIKVNKID